MLVPGWRPMPPTFPDWWQALPLPPRAEAAAPAPSSPQKRPAIPQADLFGAPTQVGDWVSELLASSAYKTQRAMAARVAPADEDIRRLLEALAERGGKLSKAAVATRLALPPLRVTGFLSAARRVLNIDQSAVLVVDEPSGTIELNQSLLRVQFELQRPS
jgi:hypothetical protein